MVGMKRVRDSIDQAAGKVLAAAGSTQRAIIGLGAGLIAVTLIALAALFLGARAAAKLRAA